jgi:hypothetical protein
MTTKTRFQRCWRVVRNSAPRTVRLLIFTSFLLLVLLIGTPVTQRGTLAGNTVGSFEIDGNLVVNHPVPPAEPIDWDSSPFPVVVNHAGQFPPKSLCRPGYHKHVRRDTLSLKKSLQICNKMQELFFG